MALRFTLHGECVTLAQQQYLLHMIKITTFE